MRFRANYKPIAEGIFGMLQDMANRGDESYLGALAFGMLPAPLMEMAEKSFVEKLGSQVTRQDISEFNHGLSLALLQVAKEHNNLVV